jgi:hypothetical protein
MTAPALKRMALLLLALGVLAGRGALADEEGVVGKAGSGIKKGGEAAGRGIEKGADAAGKGIEKGGDAAVKGVKKAGKWVGKGLHKAGEKIEKVAE